MNKTTKTPVKIELEALPAFADNGRDNLLLQVVRYLKQLFQAHLEEGSSLILPSVADLAMLMGCSPLDVLDAFYELRRQGYAYAMDDLYRPVVFEDLLGVRTDCPPSGKPFSSLSRFSDLLRHKFA